MLYTHHHHHHRCCCCLASVCPMMWAWTFSFPYHASSSLHVFSLHLVRHADTHTVSSHTITTITNISYLHCKYQYFIFTLQIPIFHFCFLWQVAYGQYWTKERCAQIPVNITIHHADYCQHLYKGTLYFVLHARISHTDSICLWECTRQIQCLFHLVYKSHCLLYSVWMVDLQRTISATAISHLQHVHIIKKTQHQSCCQ